MKRCYYEVLEVDRKSTPAEIKTSYRKMALKFHPDKNSAEDAKERFVEINEAYNVLSDPNERTWYDNNREKLLYNKDEMSKEDIEQYSFGFNIWTYFTTGCFKGYEDAQGGFYAVYRDVFQKLKAEESKAFKMREDLEEDQKKYEGFGDSTTSQERVLKFYEDWENFSTYKTFVWSEEWDTRDANSRWVRREMQKQNKKQRQGEKKTYIKTIKDLLSYVRKRDPRFMEYLRQVKEEEEKKEQERLERQKEKKKEKQEMKVVKQKLEEERFKQIEQYYKKQNELNATTTTTHTSHHRPHVQHFEEDQNPYAEFYCEICDKEFKSENQLRNHEKSKQHKQMIKDIEKQVLLKEEILQKAREQEEKEEKEEAVKEADEETKEEEPSPAKKKKNKKKKNQKKEEESDAQQTKQPPKPAETAKGKKVEQPQKSEKKVEQPKKQAKKAEQSKKQAKKAEQPKKQAKKQEPQSAKDSSSDDDDHFMNTLLNNRVKKGDIKIQAPTIAKNDKKKKQTKAPIDQSDSDEEENQQRIGKAKLKKQKKAEQQKTKGSDMKCNVCNDSFPSKSKLFQHLTKTGHASAK